MAYALPMLTSGSVQNTLTLVTPANTFSLTTTATSPLGIFNQAVQRTGFMSYSSGVGYYTYAQDSLGQYVTGAAVEIDLAPYVISPADGAGYADSYARVGRSLFGYNGPYMNGSEEYYTLGEVRFNWRIFSYGTMSGSTSQAVGFEITTDVPMGRVWLGESFGTAEVTLANSLPVGSHWFLVEFNPQSEQIIGTPESEARYESNPNIGWQVNVSTVPEPSTYAMALAGIACGGFSIWRRRMRGQAAARSVPQRKGRCPATAAIVVFTATAFGAGYAHALPVLTSGSASISATVVGGGGGTLSRTASASGLVGPGQSGAYLKITEENKTFNDPSYSYYEQTSPSSSLHIVADVSLASSSSAFGARLGASAYLSRSTYVGGPYTLGSEEYYSLGSVIFDRVLWREDWQNTGQEASASVTGQVWFQITSDVPMGRVWLMNNTSGFAPANPQVTLANSLDAGGQWFSMSYSESESLGAGESVASMQENWSVNVSAVPEPSTWVMGLAGIACAGWGMRRRRLALTGGRRPSMSRA